MKQNNKKKNTFVAENACGSHFFCNLHPISEKASIGEMLEWLKRQDRKSTRLNSSHRCTSRMPSSA